MEFKADGIRVERQRIIGKCAKCGGNVRHLYGKGRSKTTICEHCGTINPRIQYGIDDEEIIKAMKRAWNELTTKLKISELDGVAFARVVEYLLGRSIPEDLWRRRSKQWLERAGLEVCDGKVRKQ